MERSDIKNRLPLYLVMGIAPQNGRNAVEIAEAAIAGGVTMLQLREKHAPMRLVLEIGAAIRGVCRRHGVLFIVNDRVDVALLLDADGVHVGQDDLPCRKARQLLGDGKIVGVSAGNMDEAEAAVSDDADYLGVGAIYPTATKLDAGAAVGTELLARIRQNWPVPLVGIGGINADNAAAVIQAGASGIAVVSAITGSVDPGAATRKLLTTVQTALH